jgi:hypothetical protein
VRGQANLPALVVALLVVTTTAGLALAIADGAFAGAERDAAERRAALSLAERLVAADSALTTRTNVLNASVLSGLTPPLLTAEFPIADGSEVRIRLGDRAVVERGDATGGATVRRVVLVERRQSVSYEPPLDRGRTTLPRRTDRVYLDISSTGATVRTVRANDRVVLHEPNGLDGNYSVRLSRYETTTLAFEATGPLSRGDVRVTYVPAETTKATLEVTVDD